MKLLIVLYHLLKLVGIGTIAVFAGLIYERMPAIAADRTVKVEVTNDPLSVELDGQPIGVHVDDEPLPVTIER